MVGGMNHLVDQIAMGHWPGVGHLLGVLSYGFFYIMSGESPPISLLIPIGFLPTCIDRSQIALALIYSA